MLGFDEKDYENGFLHSWDSANYFFFDELQIQQRRYWFVKNWKPGPLIDFAHAVWDNELHVIGGRPDTVGNCVPHYWYYDVSTRNAAWILSPNEFPYSVCGAAAAVLDNKLFVSGGTTAGAPTDRVFYTVMHSGANGWAEVAQLPGPMTGHTMIAFGPQCNQFMVYGQHVNTSRETMHYYHHDQASDTGTRDTRRPGPHRFTIFNWHCH